MHAPAERAKIHCLAAALKSQFFISGMVYTSVLMASRRLLQRRLGVLYVMVLAVVSSVAVVRRICLPGTGLRGGDSGAYRFTMKGYSTLGLAQKVNVAGMNTGQTIRYDQVHREL